METCKIELTNTPAHNDLLVVVVAGVVNTGQYKENRVKALTVIAYPDDAGIIGIELEFIVSERLTIPTIEIHEEGTYRERFKKPL